MEYLFNLWAPSDHSKTTILCADMNVALDIFCKNRGFIDHCDYCQKKQLTDSDINIETVKGYAQCN